MAEGKDPLHLLMRLIALSCSHIVPVYTLIFCTHKLDNQNPEFCNSPCFSYFYPDDISNVQRLSETTIDGTVPSSCQPSLSSTEDHAGNLKIYKSKQKLRSTISSPGKVLGTRLKKQAYRRAHFRSFLKRAQSRKHDLVLLF